MRRSRALRVPGPLAGIVASRYLGIVGRGRVAAVSVACVGFHVIFGAFVKPHQRLNGFEGIYRKIGPKKNVRFFIVGEVGEKTHSFSNVRFLRQKGDIAFRPADECFHIVIHEAQLG